MYKIAKFVSEGDFGSAVAVIKQTNALPAITGRVCPQEDQCEGVCTLSKRFEPVAIGRLERFIADWEASTGRINRLHQPRRAVKGGGGCVGSRPAGLTVAADLARMGHKVTIFEALHEAGGVFCYGIPEFRLPKSIVKREVDYVRSLGVEVGWDFLVGSSATIDGCLTEYNAVFLGTGAGLPWFLNIPGEKPGRDLFL